MQCQLKIPLFAGLLGCYWVQSYLCPFWWSVVQTHICLVSIVLLAAAPLSGKSPDCTAIPSYKEFGGCTKERCSAVIELCNVGSENGAVVSACWLKCILLDVYDWWTISFKLIHYRTIALTSELVPNTFCMQRQWLVCSSVFLVRYTISIVRYTISIVQYTISISHIDSAYHIDIPYR